MMTLEQLIAKIDRFNDVQEWGDVKDDVAILMKAIDILLRPDLTDELRAEVGRITHNVREKYEYKAFNN